MPKIRATSVEKANARVTDPITIIAERLEVVGEALSCDVCDVMQKNDGTPVDVYRAIRDGKMYMTFCVLCLDKIEAEGEEEETPAKKAVKK